MKNRINFLLVFLILMISSGQSFSQENYQKKWDEVKSFVDKGLPQSAMAVVDEIYTDAKKTNNAPQFLKAALYQIKLRSDYQENYMEESIGRISAELITSQPPIRQMLHSILAELYWRYYQGNLYLFMNRTSISNPDPDDIKTWDVQTLMDAIKLHYRASLSGAEALKLISLSAYDPIIDPEKGSREFRPTLYDFITHRALDFFMTDEYGIIKPSVQFELDQQDYFTPATVFVQYDIHSKDTSSLKFNALVLLQNLIAFHLQDKDPKALIDVDLKRLKFVMDNCILPEKYDLFLESLKELENRYSEHPNSTDVTHEIALEYFRRGQAYNPFVSPANHYDLKNSREACERAISRFPDSDGAKNCTILRGQIDGMTLNLTSRYANVPGKPFIGSLSYKNVSKVYFKIVSLEPDQDRNMRQQYRNEALIEQYKSLTAVKEWHVDLPDQGDYQDHVTDVKLPGLAVGYYVVLAGDTKDFTIEGHPVAYFSFWITNLSYISERTQEGTYEFFVLDRETGNTISNVKAEAFTQEYDYQTRSYNFKKLESYTSDADGHFKIFAPEGRSKSFYMAFTKGNDRFYTENYFYLYPPQPEEKQQIITHFFTDRSIYRPGQTVYFKGIVLEHQGDQYKIKPDFSTLVGLYDVNDQKISELLLTTNEFGSFNGTFATPQSVLTGRMTIRCESGNTSITVEEYKRPKFEVNIDPLQGSYKLGEMIKVSGKAKSYAGTPVDNASVAYRVVRNARFPFWRSWWDIYPQSPEMEIINGNAITNSDGSFQFEFKAIPDLQIDRQFQPVFSYTIYADVTDLNGETHSVEQTVSVGYKALLADVAIAEKLDLKGANSFKLSTTNLNGQKVSASGEIKIYQLAAPSRVIRSRTWTRPDVIIMNENEFLQDFPNELYDNENDPETWERLKTVMTVSFDTEKDSALLIGNLSGWNNGQYLLEILTKDAYGENVEVKKYFTAYDPGSNAIPVNQPDWLVVMKDKGEPGDTASFLVGSAEKDVKFLYEIENKGKLVSREWIDIGNRQVKLEIPLKEEFRGNFSISLAFVKGNRSYQHQQVIRVPYTNKELDITFGTFRDKLTPGQEEKWQLHITGKNGDKAAAELLASMYDASLDAFLEHDWNFSIYPFYNGSLEWDIYYAFQTMNSHMVMKQQKIRLTPVIRDYDRLNWFGFNYYGSPGIWRGGQMRKNMQYDMSSKGVPEMAIGLAAEGDREEMAADETKNVVSTQQEQPAEIVKPAEKQAEIPVRRNFEETAFFYPALKTDDNGDIVIKFKVPESLTTWKIMGLAYTKDLKIGQVEKELITQKELMVMPNPPRFIREGDRISFSTKIVSLADHKLDGTVKAEFFDALTMQPVDEKIGNTVNNQSFSVDKGNSGVFYWNIQVPEGIEAIVYRVTAISGEFSDGEENIIPVLPNRMMVTETLPLPVNGKGTREFRFDKLIASGKSSTIRNYRLTLEFTSNPAWYAVQALPYMLENTNESSESLFNRYYANSLASFIANSNPKIKQVFDTWKTLSPGAFLSNLEKNEQLKAVILEETPWVLQARSEGERKQRIALLFDLNRMANEEQSALQKLQQMQSPNGGWSWFPEMPDNRHITQLIITGFGKLFKMNVIDLAKEPLASNMVQRGLYYMDERLREDYEKMKEDYGEKLNEDHLSEIDIQYLYARSFYQGISVVNPASQEAFDYYKGQAEKYWLNQNKYMQGMIALALFRMGEPEIPGAIIKSLKENALLSDEMGMYWREPGGFYWFEALIERQAMMIEAFSEIADDQASVEKMKVWLLKQKQTQDWKTGKATAEAVYALLLKGVDLLASDELVKVTLGDKLVDPKKTEGTTVQAGTGYYQVSWPGSEVKSGMGKISVQKDDDGVAWGAVYWQYFENLDKISAAQTPLSIEKQVYLERNTPEGPVLEPVGEGSVLKTGDKLKIRIVIRVDRNMEYIHMKDMRAAAFEPVNILSGYRYQGGLGYYEATKDASTNFFIDYLRKGTYVFEYPLIVTQKGDFSNGITTIQCLYAPEFSAHSEGVRVKVQ